jgi:hypothetical protein
MCAQLCALRRCSAYFAPRSSSSHQADVGAGLVRMLLDGMRFVAEYLASCLASCRAGQAELGRQELGRVHLVLLDGRPRRGGEHRLQVILQVGSSSFA